MFFKHLAGFAFSALLILGCCLLSDARAFQVESKNPPPAAASPEAFTSLEGRFAIALPPPISGFRAITFETPQGRVTAGDAYSWQVGEAHYEVGYVDRSRTPKAPADVKELMRVFSDETVVQAAAMEGKVLSNGEFTAAGLAGREVRVELGTMYVFNRFVGAGDRVYRLTAAFKKDPQSLEAATKTLDSFKVLTTADVEAAMRKKLDEATPAPLPQEPVAPKAKSDAEDSGLRGQVNTVTDESEDLSGTAAVRGRKPSSVSYYNERGNLTKRVSYDYKGNPMDVIVYGYLDGERVMKYGFISHEYDPPPPPMAMPPAPTGRPRPQYDHRYSGRQKYRYDEKGRQVERLTFGNEGRLRGRAGYSYSGNQVEGLFYSADGELDRKETVVLDGKGHEIEKTVVESRGNKTTRYSYSYEFDATGNWVKRITSQWVEKDGKAFFEPRYVTHRTITYY